MEKSEIIRQRLDFARRVKGRENLMATAFIRDGILVVWSCELQRYEVPVSLIPCLAALHKSAVENFTLNGSGSRLNWPEADVDLGLASIRRFVKRAGRT